MHHVVVIIGSRAVLGFMQVYKVVPLTPLPRENIPRSSYVVAHTQGQVSRTASQSSHSHHGIHAPNGSLQT
jgi:hypothetical protein